MRLNAATAILAALLIAGCATISTHVVELDPAHKYPPTQNVEVLLEKPKRPHVDIALLESHGEIGVTEAELLNDAREKAKALGADAIVRLNAERVYHPPVAVYDPWYEPFYWHGYRFRALPPYPLPWGPYEVIDGGFTTTLKAMAIKYSG